MKVLDPSEVIDKAEAIGRAKAERTVNRSLNLTAAAVMAGAFIGLGALLSVVAGFGFPQATAGNPALQRLLSGATFPVGLVLVVVLGAELFTGNNALLVPGYMRGHIGAATVARNWAVVWAGNFVGALLVAWAFGCVGGVLMAEPYAAAVSAMAQAKVGMAWMVVFVKAIGANWCVCLAVWLALSGHSLVDKVAGCWLPVMAFVALGFEHCIANMFFIPMGMMAGADVTVWQMVWCNLVPATLGNIVGGAVFVGCLHTAVHGGVRRQ